MQSCALKYVGLPNEDPWQVNKGTMLNPVATILGKSEYYYTTEDGYKGWRYSSCGIVKVFGKEYYLTKFFGMNTQRYAFKFKYQNKVEFMEYVSVTKAQHET